VGGAPEEIERRLAAGEWLRPGDVALLLKVDRRTVDRLLRAERIRYRLVPGTGRYRECHPDDVQRELDDRRRVHGG
jgi:hypothetical protein